jgi:hypothetical protein
MKKLMFVCAFLCIFENCGTGLSEREKCYEKSSCDTRIGVCLIRQLFFRQRTTFRATTSTTEITGTNTTTITATTTNTTPSEVDLLLCSVEKRNCLESCDKKHKF